MNFKWCVVVYCIVLPLLYTFFHVFWPILYFLREKRIMKLATIYHNFIQLIPHFAGIKKENIPKTMQTCCVEEKIGKFFCRGFKKLDEYGEIKTKAIHHFNWQVRDRRRLIAHWSEWLGDMDIFSISYPHFSST